MEPVRALFRNLSGASMHTTPHNYHTRNILMVVTALFTVFYVITLCWLLQDIQAQISLFRNELSGIRYIRSLELFRESLQQERITALASHHLSKESSTLLEVQRKASQERLYQLDTEGLQYAKKFRVWNDWQKLRPQIAPNLLPLDTLAATPSYHMEGYFALTSALYRMMQKVTDRSNLILDASRDSYYLMETATQKIPALDEKLGRLSLMLMQYIDKAQPSEVDEHHLLRLTYELELLQRYTSRTLVDAVKNNPLRAYYLMKMGDRLATAIHALTDPIQKMAEDNTSDGHINLTPQQLH